MLKNYLKIAWRNLLKSKTYSSINILGLAFGMAVALLIGLWMRDELTFNHYHPNHKYIAQVMATRTYNGQTNTEPAVAVPLADELRSQYASDFRYTSLTSWNLGFIVRSGEKKLIKTGLWVQSQFPRIIGLRMIDGDINSLNDPSSILISHTLAVALFGNVNPMGQTVRINNEFDSKVAGIYRDIPKNSSFYEINILLPWDKYVSTQPWVKESVTQWENHSFRIFVQINNNLDMEKVSAKIKLITRKYLQKEHGDEHLLLHPMDKWHLYSTFENGKLIGGRIQYVWLFGIIAVFVLLLACINFMNLSTARSMNRAKEVGVRKAIGSIRRQLIFQFLSESILMAILALSVAILFVILSLPFFNSLSNKHMGIPWTNVLFWLLILIFTGFTGLIAGSYPAIYLSAFNPVKILNGTFKAGRFASMPREILVVIQFTISISLAVAAVTVFRQLQYGKDRPIGYTRENMLTVAINSPELLDHIEALRNDIMATGAAESLAVSSCPTTEVWSNTIRIDWDGKAPGSNPLFATVAVTHDFGKTIGWHIIKGRDFSKEYSTDTAAIILNRNAVGMIDNKNPLNKIIRYDNKSYKVVGVIENMIMQSPYTTIQPTIFIINDTRANVIIIKMKSKIPLHEGLAKIGEVFRRYTLGSPFDYHFIKEEYARKFSDEDRIVKLASIFAALTIFISLLGLFGLASFIAEQKAREIGIRKILGASIRKLWLLLCLDFIKLVTISCIIAVPLSWYFLWEWLKQYQYHTQTSLWVFVAVCTGSMLLTLITVSMQAIKAATANPVKSLKTE